MPRIRSHKERTEREDKVRAMIDKGMSLNEIARELNLSSQSVHKFITLRGWKTQAAQAQTSTS